MTKAITLWSKVFPLGLPFIWSARSYPKWWHCWDCHLHSALCKQLSEKVGWIFVYVLLLITIKDLKNWLPQIENTKLVVFALHLGKVRSRSWAVAVTHRVLRGGSAAAAGSGELQQQKEHAREEECAKLSVIPFQRFSQLLCRLSADDGCTDGMRFLHMLSIHPSSSLRRRQCKQTWGWTSHPALLERRGRHIYKCQWEGGKRKNSPEMEKFNLCPDFKQLQSGKFGFKTLFQFIPPKRRHPRKGEKLEK